MQLKKRKPRSRPEGNTHPSEKRTKEKDSVKRRAEGGFYIVGMGGSAGALEAFEQFFHNLPSEPGMAFVLVPHLDPTHKGIMPELLQRLTPMKVFQVQDGMKVQPNKVYVIPPNRDMAIMNGTLQLLEPSAPRGLRLPSDFFFRHLAEDQKEWSIAIILSGMGTDGTLGLKAIKEQMGMAMVQEPNSAKYNGMPRSALDTGLADYVAPAEGLPEKLIGYTNHFSKVRTDLPPVESKTQSALQKVLILLRGKIGNDFSQYKKSTILRRIDRRMSVHQITQMSHYVRLLQESSQEIDLLFKELLIGVTNFFRDPDAFACLKNEAILPLLRSRDGNGTIRVWVPGCSSGEEAYSIAILFRECIDKEPGLSTRVQIYATDIDQDAISSARQGVYPLNIAADVSPDRLQRYFIKEEVDCRIRKEIREMVVFAPQNLIADPPFTKLDLLCCRNLFIYLTPELQKKLLPLFHYTLNPGGYLFLGSSETIGGHSEFFSSVNSKWKLFSRCDSISAPTGLPEFPLLAQPLERGGRPVADKSLTGTVASFPQVIQRIIVETVSPPAVFINEKGELLYSTQRTGKYFEPPVGRANLNVLEMAREGLKIELAVALRQAINQGSTVHVKRLAVKTNGAEQLVNLTVRPLMDPESVRGVFLLVFEEIPPEVKRRGKRSGPESGAGQGARIADLEKDLQQTREHLQTIIEEMETSQEELKSTNEELQSTNEELQSTNEELTTSKEELQSLNEELLTVNAELQAKNDELALANNDMQNLLNSTQVPTIFLDNSLHIKRFTTPATNVFALIPTDVGRPVTDIVSHLRYDNLIVDMQNVIATLVFKEKQVQTKNGNWYVMRIMPYRTMENKIDGVVISFNEITELKKLEMSLREHDRWRLLAGLVRDSNDAVTVQDPNGAIRVWNKGAERLYGWTEAEALGRNALDWIAEPKRKEYQAFLLQVQAGETGASIETQRMTKKGQVLDVWFTITKLTDGDGRLTAIATTERDITERKQTEEALRESEAR